MKKLESIESAERRYSEAAHAMQSGVAHEMNTNHLHPERDPATQPKHLRVGVNSALVNDAALAKLLIAKGIITLQEYMIAVADEMEEEVQRYEASANKGFGSVKFK